MTWYYDDYESAAERKARVLLEINKRRKKGEPFVVLETRKKRGNPCETFWGKAWCDNLENYSDYENRLPRGRTYLRGGNVYDLEITEGEIFAYVTGSDIYDVLVTIDPYPEEDWRAFKKACGGEISTLLDLLGGSLGSAALERITDIEKGLFPSPREIRFSCTCPDHAGMCKHVAATLYGVGLVLDTAPEKFFQLRSIDHMELVSEAMTYAGKVGEATGEHRDGADGVLGADDLSELFGIEISEPETAF